MVRDFMGTSTIQGALRFPPTGRPASFHRTSPAAVEFRSRGQEGGHDSRFHVAYRSALVSLLRHPWLTVAAVLGVFVATLASFGFVPKLFFPSADRSFFTAQLSLPTGTAIEATDEMAGEIDRFLAEELAAAPERPEGVVNWATFVGGGEPRYILNANVEQANSAYAFMLINTTSAGAVPEAMARLDGFCRRSFPDLVATIRPSEYGPPVSFRRRGEPPARRRGARPGAAAIAGRRALGSERGVLG